MIPLVTIAVRPRAGEQYDSRHPQNLAEVMRWSFASIVLTPRGEWGPPPDTAERARVFRTAAEAGFEGIELNPRWYNFLSFTETDLQALAQEVSDAGLVISGLNISRCIPTRTIDADLHRWQMEAAVNAAPVLGAGIVTVSLSMPTLPTPDRPVLLGSDIPDDEHQRAAEIVTGLADRAAGVGVTLAVELHDDGLLDTPELCLQLVQRVGRPNVGVNPDVGNVCRGPGPVADWRAALAALGPFTTNWHAKNYRDGRPSPVWDGVIDYSEAVSLMTQAGYRGWISIESYFGDVFDLQAQSLAYLRPLALTP